MQADSVMPLFFQNTPYDRDMAGRPTTKPAPPFGQRIASLRQERGWTQPALAARLGTNVKMVTYYEREAKNPTRKTIEQFAHAFGISPAELVSEPSPTKPPRSKPGPPSRLLKLTERLSDLPRQKQKVVIEMLEGVLHRFGSNSQ